jgi:hypothetical protein
MTIGNLTSNMNKPEEHFVGPIIRGPIILRDEFSREQLSLGMNYLRMKYPRE